MANKMGRCSNYDGCSKALQRAQIEADEFSFVCPECGKPLKALLSSSSRTGPNWPLLLGLLALLSAFAGGIAYYLLQPSPERPLPQPTPQPQPQPKPAPISAAPDSIDCHPQPLLMDGKRSLFQRVLAKPKTILYEEPNNGELKELIALDPYYVYQRKQINGEEWLQVSQWLDCKPTTGWMLAKQSVPWKQQITVAFDNPAQRDRVLMFNKAKDMQQIINSSSREAQLATLQASIGHPPYDERIVSVEPKNFVDLAQRRYLLPIVDFIETSSNGMPLQLLKIHSISDNAPIIEPPPEKSAVVFVIDSTVSMKDYINDTKNAVKQIFDDLSQSPGGSNIGFGLVAFRSSTDAVPELDYVSKILVCPEDVDNKNSFLKAIGGVKEASVSSKKFDEDAYAGIYEALSIFKGDLGVQKHVDSKSCKIEEYASRHIILISDAGPLKSSDTLSRDKKGTQDLFALAKGSNVNLYAMHLKTAKGLEVGNHPYAERNYRDLTQNQQIQGSLYYPIENDASSAYFKPQIKCISGFISTIIGGMKTNVDNSKDILKNCPPIPNDQKLDQAIERMRHHATILGEVLRLEYLGHTKEGNSVPDDFDGWMADRDLTNPIRPTVDVRIFLTRRELENLIISVQTILNAVSSQKTSAEQFFNSLRDYAAKISRDPSRAKPKETVTIEDMGILGEYMEGLPYQSAVMKLSQDSWTNMEASEQEEFKLSLKTKLERYRDYLADNALWYPKDTSVPEDLKTYPVPLDALP